MFYPKTLKTGIYYTDVLFSCYSLAIFLLREILLILFFRGFRCDYFFRFGFRFSKGEFYKLPIGHFF